jgi:hypothetical protein
MRSEPHEDWERIKHEDIDPDSETYTIPSEIDIDQFVEDCNFRVEKLGTDGLWVCAYTQEPAEPDHHYTIRAEDDELLISHERDYRRSE